MSTPAPRKKIEVENIEEVVADQYYANVEPS
jgi:hypothetical protein